ncbi:MAG: two-component system sensor histidine kinase BaeS [Paraglaciecola sp.]|jgi:two-component system sensor histidine kinase BaeS
MDEQHRRFHHLILKQLAGSNSGPSERSLRRSPDHRLQNKTNNVPSQSKQNRPRPDDFSSKIPPPPYRGERQYALLDIDHKLIAGNYVDELEYIKTTIKVNDIVIGFFAVSKRNRLSQGYEVDFIEQQQDYLWLISLVVMSLVTLVTFPLARHVVEPIKLIAQGIHKLTQGDYHQSIELTRQDELGELCRDYNELALTLA